MKTYIIEYTFLSNLGIGWIPKTKTLTDDAQFKREMTRLTTGIIEGRIIIKSIKCATIGSIMITPNCKIILDEARQTHKDGFTYKRISQAINYSYGVNGAYVTLDFTRITDSESIEKAATILTRLARLEAS